MKALYALLVAVVTVGGVVACGSGGPTCSRDTAPDRYIVRLCVQPVAATPDRTMINATVGISNGTAPPINGITYTLDGRYLTLDAQAPFAFALHSYWYSPGQHTLTASVAFSGGYRSPPLTVPLYVEPSAPPPGPAPFRATPGGAPPVGQPLVVAAAGDGASGLTAETQVTDLIASWNPNLVLYLGDVYGHGSPEDFANWYGERNHLYGRFRSITNPTLGNHEFDSDRTGRPYYDFWGGPPAYYSYDTHGWHVITLDNVSPSTVLSTTSAQYRWLVADLAEHANPCTLVTYHRPRFTEGRSETEGPSEAAADFDAFWRLLADNRVPLVLNGHSHNYQRWQPMNADGAVVTGGTTEFIVGTGGQWTSPLLAPDPRMAVGFEAWGALRLALSADGATYRFVDTAGATRDSGFVPCAGTGPAVPTTPAGS